MDALLDCLKEQSDLLAEFIQALNAETASLLDNPSDLALAEITIRKNDFARRLADLDQKRSAGLLDLGYADDMDGVGAACLQYPELQEAFDHLWGLAEEANALNQQNGQILHTYMGHNQRALETLHSLLNTNLYDSDGRISRTRG